MTFVKKNSTFVWNFFSFGVVCISEKYFVLPTYSTQMINKFYSIGHSFFGFANLNFLLWDESVNETLKYTIAEYVNVENLEG